ncbi:bifunctional DNA primase/polymerase [Pedobacter agri]|uniref:bifunctional DNA primase/polymerase n=1 Tax=Pedobacter agri TaxID=454586 RepID=UPI002787CCC3|nr:bifunctional DNA primase/polymerase [Pedobacter agri]MDQ1139461.1 hypothetical protein [Pedobacter agri]
MITLSQVWSHVETFLADGISLIPVRDKDEKNKYGEVLVAKSTYGKWKEFQTRRMDKTELWRAMEERDTTAVAIICGKVSGNMEVIDIDVKYNPGIDAILFADLQSFYPDLFAKLRIHKTPSGGYHIIYRVDESHPVPGNLKLAGRMATDQEIQAQLDRGLKRPNKEVNFLETRAEGGYILAPPSLGYSVHQDHPIPLLSWEERCSIIRLCESYTTIIKEAPKPTLTKKEDEWYDENPFEHYNRTVNPTQVVADFGWKYLRENAQFIWYTRPDKQRGVSLSWNKQKHIFYVFTSSTELQANKGYHPSTIMAELGFAGDKKQAYKWLTDNGFGIVKPSVEASVVKKAAHAGKGLPSNFSDNAKQLLEQQTEQLKKDHPYGEFIKYDYESEKLTVSYESLLYVAKMLGLYNYEGLVVHVVDHTIELISDRKFQDILKAYIKAEEVEEYEKLCDVFEKFLKENTKYVSSRLPLLPEEKICRDSRSECFKFYKNGYLHITPYKMDFTDYSKFDKLVWTDKIQDRNWTDKTGGRFVEYLNLALVKPDAAKPILGYLSHEFKDETTGYIIVLTEACKDPKLGGGSGKNVFCNLLKLTTTYLSKPGGQGKFDEKFFQVWNNQKVFGISDLPKNFDFKAFKEPATGSFIQKKLYKDEIEVPVEKTPKFIMQTNYSFTDSDGGLIRRIIALEFTDFFTKCGGLDVHFGVHFPKGWTDQDYAGFDNYIAECIQVWMKGNCKLKPTELTEQGWLKKFELNYGEVASGFIVDCFNDIIADGEITNERFKKLISDYNNENNIPKHYEAKYKSISDGLAYYCENFGIEVKTDQTIRTSQVSTAKGRKFKSSSEIGKSHLEAAQKIKSDNSEEEIPF